MVHASVEHLEKHYADLSSKPFFRAWDAMRRSAHPSAGLVKYMASGPVVAMVWQGKDVVKQGRAMLGATNPLASAPGTIRGDFAIDVGRVRAAHTVGPADGLQNICASRFLHAHR